MEKENNKNSVELLGVYGGDESHACSAWTSTNRELTEEKRQRIGKLLKDLANHEHGTPFEKSSLHFLVNTDIATHIHIIKHRLISVNAESARYKELKEDKYYLPEDWKCDEKWLKALVKYTEEGNELYHKCLSDLTPILGRKRAKESARFFKTYNSQIAADVMFNFRSFMHFQHLRNSEHAQVEVRWVAQEMLRLVKETGQFNLSLEAFGY